MADKCKPGITILPITYDNFDVNKAASITAAALVARPNLGLIYAPSGPHGPQGQGDVSAVEAAHKTGKAKIWAFGGEPEEVDALKAGAISALIGQGAYLVGQGEVKSLVSYIKAHPHGGAMSQTSTIQMRQQLRDQQPEELSKILDTAHTSFDQRTSSTALDTRRSTRLRTSREIGSEGD